VKGYEHTRYGMSICRAEWPEAGSARACVPRLSHQLQHRGDHARLEGQGVEIDRQTAATRAVFSHAPLDHLARDAMVLQHLLDAISDQNWRITHVRSRWHRYRTNYVTAASHSNRSTLGHSGGASITLAHHQEKAANTPNTSGAIHRTDLAAVTVTSDQ
jgi:hypothetical protein